MLKAAINSGISQLNEWRESTIESWTIADFIKHFPVLQGCRDPRRRHYFFLKKVKGNAVVDGSNFTLTDGSCLVIPVNRLYTLQVENDVEGFVFAGEELFLRTKVAPNSFTPPSHYTATYHFPKLHNHLCAVSAKQRDKVFLEIEFARERLGCGCDAAVMAYIFILAYDEVALHRFDDKGPPPREQSTELNLLIAFQALVEKNFQKHMPVSQYCEALNTTRQKLISVCKHHINIAPLVFIRNRVLIEAKQLLSNSSMNISEVAYSLGYDDPSYFSRFFKRYTGYSPVDYRQNR